MIKMLRVTLRPLLRTPLEGKRLSEWGSFVIHYYCYYHFLFIYYYYVYDHYLSYQCYWNTIHNHRLTAFSSILASFAFNNPPQEMPQ